MYVSFSVSGYFDTSTNDALHLDTHIITKDVVLTSHTMSPTKSLKSSTSLGVENQWLGGEVKNMRAM